MYNRKDHYYKKAKEEGRASRASYKLEQIQSKFRIIRKNDYVLDLGCAPGGWLEVSSELVGPKGIVVGVDILPLKIQLKPNVRYIQGDIGDPKIIDIIPPNPPLEKGGEGGFKFDSILSDMAPNTSGVAFKDCYLSYELNCMALRTAQKMLKKGGNFVTKIFQGKEVETFKKNLRKCFKNVEVYIPPATRQMSKELYLVAIDYFGT